VVACIFLFLSLLQVACCFVAIIMMRGHRRLYPALFSILYYTVFTTIWPIISIRDIITPRIFPHGFFLQIRNWLLISILATIIPFLDHCEKTIRAQSNTTSGQRNVPHSMVYILVVLMFSFAMTSTCLSAKVANNTIDVLNYIVCTLIILSAINFFVTAIIISRAAKDAATADKVCLITHFRNLETNGPLTQIINIILYVVSPLFSLLTFLHVVFLFVFSLATRSSFTSSNVADLVQDVIVHLLIFVIFGVLLSLSFDRASWDFGSTLPACEPFPAVRENDRFDLGRV